MKRLLLAGVAAGLVLAGPASAQIFGGKRQDEQIAIIQQELAALRAQINGGPPAPDGAVKPGLTATVDLTRAELTGTRTRVDDLEATLKTMNGTVEALTADLAQARRDLTAAQAENRTLVERLGRLESAQTQLSASQQAAAAQALAAREADPAAAFAEARTHLQAGRFAEAGTAFETYAARHADQPNAPEAHYWLGETYTLRQNYGDAAQAYIAALEGWPKTDWAPDAVVKLSGALIELKEPREACKSLAELDRRYASAPAAVKTRARAARTRAKCA
jgi:tol-pal system protein YbgF